VTPHWWEVIAFWYSYEKPSWPIMLYPRTHERLDVTTWSTDATQLKFVLTGSRLAVPEAITFQTSAEYSWGSKTNLADLADVQTLASS